MVVQKEFLERVHKIVWCTVATVGPDLRPRTRILHPIWEVADRSSGGLVGWIVTRATPVKVRHLEFSPYLSCSYWEPGQEVAVADCGAEWVADVATRERVWELYRDTPPPLGYDFWSVFPDGPSGGITLAAAAHAVPAAADRRGDAQRPQSTCGLAIAPVDPRHSS